MPAASPVLSALRPPRTVAVRRALLAVLFLGGLLGLALVFGGSAHAASPGRTAPVAGSGQVAAEAGPADTAPAGGGADIPDGVSAHADVGTPGPEAPAPDRRDAEPAPAGAESAVRQQHTPVTLDAGPAAEPVTHRAERIVRPVAEGTGALLRDVTGGAVRLPAAGSPGGGTGSGPWPGGGEDRAADPSGTGGTASPVTRHDDAAAWSGTAPEPQSRFTGGHDAPPPGSGADGRDEHQRDGRSVPLPGMPHGTSSAGSADGGSRAGDPCALCGQGIPRFGLAPGGVGAAAAAPTRERSADILEFPG